MAIVCGIKDPAAAAAVSKARKDFIKLIKELDRKDLIDVVNLANAGGDILEVGSNYKAFIYHDLEQYLNFRTDDLTLTKPMLVKFIVRDAASSPAIDLKREFYYWNNKFEQVNIYKEVERYGYEVARFLYSNKELAEKYGIVLPKNNPFAVALVNYKD